MKCFTCKKEVVKEKSCSYQGNLYCAKHYQQILKFGHTLDIEQRTVQDLNDFEFIDEETVEIITFNKASKRSGSFTIDKTDFERVIKKKWRNWKGRIFTGNFNPMSITEFLLGDYAKEGLVCDHIDSNPFNNKRSNLRLITQQENLINKKLLSNNSSGFAGIYFDRDRNKWCSEIKRGYVKCYLGRFTLLEDAVYARYIAELLLFKELRSTQNDENIFKEIEKCQNKNKIHATIKNKIMGKYNVN